MRILTKLRCPDHGDMVMVQRRSGQIVFWCGCERSARSFENSRTVLKEKVVEVRRSRP